jgi:uncharacterized protein YdeI (YjbR/CyaY-like superfamily)
MKPTFFKTPEDLRNWFTANTATVTELTIGFYKVGSGKPSITWPQSVQEALCVGWIDGVRKRIDDESYQIRFTPRKKDSIWSAVNIRLAEELIKSGRMQPAGLTAYQARSANKSAIYSYEQQQPAELPAAYLKQLQANAAAWEYFQSKTPPSYKRAVADWVTRAKQEATREKRLAQLIACSAQGRPVPPLTPRTGK